MCADSARDALHISVVIPAYNEEEVIASVVEQVAEKVPGPKEIFVVDDGSSDGTAAAAERAGARVIRFPYNKGNGAAVKAGIRAASGQVVVLMDGDGHGIAAPSKKSNNGANG